MTNINSKTRDICLCGMMTALIAVCSWISIPIGEVPITLQTFAVFAAVGLLGGKRGTISIVAYVLMGAVGIPVFANFTGGLGIIAGNTGGYIAGFIGSALVVWLMERISKGRLWLTAVSMALGMLVCYIFGTAWFMIFYTRAEGAVALGTVLGWCVTPFIIPDAVKIACAVILTERVKKYVGDPA